MNSPAEWRLVLLKGLAPGSQSMSETNFSHFIRAFLAIGLTAALPFMLYVDVVRSPDVIQAYRDALAAVIAFYFGATATPTD